MENPGKVIELEEARRRSKEEGRGGWEVWHAFYMQLFCIGNDYFSGEIVKCNPNKMPAGSQMEVN